MKTRGQALYYLRQLPGLLLPALPQHRLPQCALAIKYWPSYLRREGYRDRGMYMFGFANKRESLF